MEDPELGKILDDLIDGAVPFRGNTFFRERTKRHDGHSAGFRAGMLIGDFRLVGMIGQGGMGQVWEARQESLGGRRIAVKFMRQGLIAEKRSAYFERESRAVARLSHPGIVTVFGAGESDGIAWIAMELVQGTWTLRDMLDQLALEGSLPKGHARQAAEFARHLALAVHAAHQSGVIHRDLKPQNILITPDDRPKLTDFGLAQIVGESALSETGDFAGTYFYISPEQVAAKRMGIDHRSDIFSLGVVLYEMVSLVRPFQGDSTHQIAQQILTKQAPDLRKGELQIPNDLVVIIEKAMEKDRDMRFQSMQELADDLERFIADKPILAKPPTRRRRVTKWCKRNPGQALAGLMCVAVVLTLGAISTAGVRASKQRDDLELRNAALEGSMRDVMGLALSVEYDDLIDRAKKLGTEPPEDPKPLERLIADADFLLEQREIAKDKRDGFRKVALPRTDAERENDRKASPGYKRLIEALRELESKTRALETRRGVRAVEPPTVSMDESGDSITLMKAAWERLSTGDDEGALDLAYAALNLDSADQATIERQYQEIEEIAETARTAAGLADAESEIAALSSEIGKLEELAARRLAWAFPQSNEGIMSRLLSEDLSRLIVNISALDDPQRGLFSPGGRSVEWGWSVPDRLEFSKRLETGFAAGGEFEFRWRRDLEAIQESYPGLNLEIQWGLVPLGKNPETDCWEFWHIQSGAEPTRDSAGAIRISEESGLVFVLIPSGEFWMGCQRMDPGGRNYYAEAQLQEGPVHEVKISAFFISKFEMTQAQWIRLTGENPSQHCDANYGAAPQVAAGLKVSKVPLDLTHPVEEITWQQCVRLLAQYGVGLPSEAQWEYGARAGTGTIWWSGDERESLLDPLAINLADLSAEEMGQPFSSINDWPELDDGFPYHAPVDRFAPNPFGLLSVHGNVRELCLDAFGQDYYWNSAELDPVNLDDQNPDHVVRGADFASNSRPSGSGARGQIEWGGRSNLVGVRPARAVQVQRD